MKRTLLVGMSLALVIAACAAPSGSGDAGSDVSVPDTRPSPIDEAIDDLLVRIGDGAQIEVVLYEDVVWRDGSLGCPQPGMSYTQALEDGYRIVLTDGEVEYHYHGVAAGAPFLCENAEDSLSAASQNAAPSETLPTVPPNSEGDTDVDEQPPTTELGDAASSETEVKPLPGNYDGPLANLVGIAIADLAQRRSVALSDITVVSVESVVWPDGSLGCPIPGMRYTQVQIDGAKIVLSIDGATYNYHSGGTRDPFLCVPTKAADAESPKLTLPGVDE